MSTFCKLDSRGFALRVVVESIVAAAGIALLLIAVIANLQWLDRHFLPDFFTPHSTFVLAATITRIVFAVIGVLLVFVVRPRVGKFAAGKPPGRFLSDVVAILLAIVLALATSEFILRRMSPRAAMERPPTEEPRRRRDAQLGWVFVPGRTGHDTVGGRAIEYAFDPAGYRVRRVDEPVDPDKPTIVFAGESVIAGQGLNWGETIPAQVSAITGVQSANLAVNGYASDQAYMRLSAELPRFRHLVAVVSLFTPQFFDRNLDDDRPHLGPGLVRRPAVQHWRLIGVLHFLFPYRSTETVERGMAMTREILRATVDLARERGAVPLIVVPQFIPEEPAERQIRLQILDDAGLPYAWVQLDPTWRIPNDAHPDPRAARAIAAAIASRVQPR